MRIVFMGTPDFAVPSLERLIEAGYKPVAVVTGPDRPRGRGQKLSPTPVKVVAEKHDIPILQPESVKDPAFAEQIASLHPDVIVVVAFRILPPAVFEQASRGAINLHGSLLPAFRGAAPINRAVMAGAKETGVTTFFLKKKVDTGDMILQKRIPVGPEDTAGDVHDRLMELGAEAVLETVALIDAGKAESVPQDHQLATPAPKIYKEDRRIDWARSAPEVHNQVRGLSPYPGAWTTFEGTLYKIFRTRVEKGQAAPGTLIEAEDRLVVACGEGAVEVLEIQMEGRRRMPAETFLHGNPLPKGARFDPVDRH